MDDSSLQDELELLATNATNPSSSTGTDNPEPISTTTARWQTLFRLSPDEAIDRLMSHRDNLTRTRVSDDHWEAVRSGREAVGYDREAYEYELNLQKKRAALPDAVPTAESGGQASPVTYLVELSGPLDSARKVQEVASLEAEPVEVHGESVEEERSVRLCLIDGVAKAAVLRWASEEGGGFEPTILVNPKSLR